MRQYVGLRIDADTRRHPAGSLSQCLAALIAMRLKVRWLIIDTAPAAIIHAVPKMMLSGTVCAFHKTAPTLPCVIISRRISEAAHRYDR